MRRWTVLLAAVVLVLCDVARPFAQVASNQPDTGVGAWIGAAFWIGITMLLFLGAPLLV
jgi:hypothetical protein